MFRDGKRFMVHTEGPTGEMEDFEVKYVFGWEPLQQYMVEFDRPRDMPEDEIARLQVLRISWDTEKKRWFYLRPPDVDDKLEPDDPLHWTGVAQRWQTMCADCHSTNLKRNFDPQTTTLSHDVFGNRRQLRSLSRSGQPARRTGQQQIVVLGPQLRLRTGSTEGRRRRTAAANLCPVSQPPRCAERQTSRRAIKYTDHYALGALCTDTYHADGQIKDEVYVYGSFIQSKMYHKGHPLHRLPRSALAETESIPATRLAPLVTNTPPASTTFRRTIITSPAPPGAMCVNCHMPQTTYMDVDPATRSQPASPTSRSCRSSWERPTPAAVVMFATS